MRLSDITIRTKVLMTFGLVFAVTLAMGGFAVDRLARVNTAAGEIRDKWLPGTETIARMSLSFEQYRIAEGRALVATSAEAMQTIENDLRVRADDVRQRRVGYDTIATDDQTRGMAREFDRHWQDYLAVSQEMLGLIQRGKRDEAALIYNGKARTPVAEARAAAARLMDFNINWYDNVSDPMTRALASFRALDEPHEAVHVAGSRILAALAADEFVQAEREVVAMRSASDRVLHLLDSFGREYPPTVGVERREKARA